MTDLPAGWHEDPTGKHEHRFWDGRSWTDFVIDAGVRTTDPHRPPARPEPADGPAGAGAPSTTSVSGWHTSAPSAPSAPAPLPERAGAPTPSGWQVSPREATPSPLPERAPTTGASADAGAAAGHPAPVAVPLTPAQPLTRPEHLPPPQAPASPPRASGSRRTLVLAGAGVAVVAVVGLLLTRGDDDPSEQSVTASVAASLRDAQAGIDAEQAGCMAEELVDRVGEDRLDGADLRPDTVLGADGDAELLQAYAAAAAACSAPAAPGDEGLSGDGATSTVLGVPTDPADPAQLGPFVAALADQYETALGLPPDQAACLADAVGDALAEGSIDENSSFEQLRGYFDTCGIDLSAVQPGA